MLLLLTSCGQTREVWLDGSGFDDVFAAAEVKGTFVLRQVGSKTFKSNDRVRAQTRFLPASTFKVFSALVALETGVIADEHETFAWDGEQRTVPAWNQDHDLASGIKVSAVWYFQELARRIGSERMQQWITRVGYGNRDIGGDLDAFWLTGNLRISLVEQLDFLERLYTNDLPFSQRNMDIVKDIILAESTDAWKLYGKTGWGTVNNIDIGWYVGFVERSDGVWVFANNIEIVSGEDAQHRVGISRQILSVEGIIDATARPR